MDLKESDKKLDDNISMNEKNKRARSSIGDRNYKCGCNKAYLSYPALYTHVKNKHKGIFPIGSHSKKRLPISQLEEKNEVLNINNKELINDLENFWKEIKCQKKKSEGEENSIGYVINKIDDNFIKENKIFNILNTEFLNHYKFIPNLKTIFKNFVMKYCHIEDSSDNILIEEKKIKNNQFTLNIYEVFCHFLIDSYKYIDYEFFKELVYIMIIYLYTLNDKGYEFLNSKLSKEERKKMSKKENQEEFCLLKEISIISESSNIFIAENFYEELCRMREGKIFMQYFGDEETQIYNLIQITKYFINWLFINNYTEYKAELNIDI